MTVFILPKLKDADLPAPNQTGRWERYDKTRFESVAKSLDYKAPGDNKKINSVPDMWALPMTLELPLYNNRHPLRAAAIAQWQGMLAAIALSKVRGFQLKAELIDLNRLKDNYPFAAALYQLLPNSGKSLHQLANKHPWEELYIWSWKKQAVGITSPTTIIAPAAEADWDGLPWWNSEFKRLEAPHSYLNPDEKPLLREWLNKLREEVINPGYQGDSNAIETIANLLKEYASTLTGETDRVDILDTDSPNHFGVAINRGVFNGLNYPVKGKTIALVESPVRVIPSEHKSVSKPLLLIDTYLAEHWGVPKQNICIYADKTLESLNIDDLRSGRMTDWDNNINWIEPSQLLLPDLHFMDVENALPGAFSPTTSQPLLFNKQRITPLLPIDRILLEYFTPEDLMRRLRFEPGDSSNTVRVKLNLPLVGMNPTSPRPCEYQISKEYILDERYLITEIPVLEIYPHFKIAGGGWHEYYAFYHDPSRDNSAFQVAFDDARDPHIFEDGGKYLTTRLAEFPTHINCSYQGQNIGAIVLPTPPEITLSETWKVGVDFGTSFTNIYVSHHGKNEPLKLESLHLKVTDADEETRSPALFEYFIPENFIPKDKPLPLSTILTQRGQTRNQKQRPIYDGRIYMPDTSSGFRPDSRWMKTDIKWKDKDLSQLFLQHLALIISALAAKDGAKKIEWSISYPSAFSKNETRKYVKTWEDLIVELQKQMSIEHIPPQQGEMSFRTESLAIAQYFADKEDRNLIGSACIDLGGGTSDISIWQDNRLIHQCSIQLAGRHLLSQFLELRPELISKWFGQESAGWKDLSDDQFKAKIDVLLRHNSEVWLRERRHTLEDDKDFQGLLRLMTVGIAGIYYYIGTILHTLQREEKYTESEIPAIYIGGNGSRLLHWIATGGEFNRHTDLNELFNRMLAAPSGLEEVANSTQLSQRPKDEVVCGLVTDRTNLTGLNRTDKDPSIAGESCQINSREIAWTSRLELDNDENISEFSIPQLDRLKQFVEDFNRGLKDLEIEEIKPFNTYQRKTGLDPQYSVKLWSETHKEMRKMLLDIKGKSGDIRIEPPFIIGLKALLRVLAKEWAGK
ncbi:MAG: hypothetical protein LH613_01760 [Chamaesiphon sp.]|nr:hypothetical protein [Chamaesiphon sp.]